MPVRPRVEHEILERQTVHYHSNHDDHHGGKRRRNSNFVLPKDSSHCTLASIRPWSEMNMFEERRTEKRQCHDHGRRDDDDHNMNVVENHNMEDDDLECHLCFDHRVAIGTSMICTRIRI
jgi:hypothetical protein